MIQGLPPLSFLEGLHPSNLSDFFLLSVLFQFKATSYVDPNAITPGKPSMSGTLKSSPLLARRAKGPYYT